MKRAKDFDAQYFTSPDAIQETKQTDPTILKLMISQQRSRVDYTWKPEGLKLDRQLKTLIDASNMAFKDEKKGK